MSLLIKLEKGFNRFGDLLGWVASVLFILLMINVVYDVVMRYAFNDVSIGMQEMEWHLFSIVFLLGVPYAIRTSGHVRVDVIYENLSVRSRAIINILGVLFFLMPFCLLVAWYGIFFAQESYELGEMSGDPGGLPHRWVIKSLISISFFCMAISGISLLLNSINRLMNPLHPELGQENKAMNGQGELS